jgi:hypothetical protein
VELVDDERLAREPAPPGVVPAMPLRVEQRGRAVHAVRLAPARGIRSHALAVEHERVLGALAQAVDRSLEPAIRLRGERMVAAAGADCDAPDLGRPDGEAYAAREEHRTVWMRGHGALILGFAARRGSPPYGFTGLDTGLDW